MGARRSGMAFPETGVGEPRLTIDLSYKGIP